MAVSKQFNNRRQPVLINEINPEILTETKLSADGFVKNTDYAKADIGGVFKTGTAYATAVTSSGALTSQAKTAEQYASGNTNMFISKGTLENVKSVFVSGGLSTIADTLSPTAAEGTVFKDLALVKGADGSWSVTFLTITPPTP